MANKAFVTGYPVTHSRSPLIHRYWLKKYAISGSYDPIEVTVDDFPAFIASLKNRGLSGGNVTLPHKEKAFALAQRPDDIAQKIGAANTLWFEGDLLCASNTDAYGFSANLDDFSPNWAGGTALVLGAGGAARAIVYALKMRGFERVVIFNRTLARAEELARHFDAEAQDWSKINDFIHQADFIVNTTSLGMESHISHQDNTLFVDFSKAKPGMLVTDIVYTPLVTPILQQAQKAGIKTVDGLGMLLHQAVPGFERWFGVRPAVDKELRDLVLKDLGL